MSTFTSTVKKKLVARADERAKAWSEKYFLGVVPFIGCKSAATMAVVREVLPTANALDDDALVTEAFALVRDRHMEMKQVGVELLYRRRRTLGPAIVDALAPLFDDGSVKEWATCDGIAGHVLRYQLPNAGARKKIVAWSKAKNDWRQRASAVAFVNEAKHGRYDDDIVDVCSRIVRNPDRFVQLGCGWALRELSRVDRKRVIAFVDDNAAFLSREGLRYALEKTPADVRAQVMASHKDKARRAS